jgi:hypothetical protein
VGLRIRDPTKITSSHPIKRTKSIEKVDLIHHHNNLPYPVTPTPFSGYHHHHPFSFSVLKSPTTFPHSLPSSSIFLNSTTTTTLLNQTNKPLSHHHKIKQNTKPQKEINIVVFCFFVVVALLITNPEVGLISFFSATQHFPIILTYNLLHSPCSLIVSSNVCNCSHLYLLLLLRLQKKHLLPHFFFCTHSFSVLFCLFCSMLCPFSFRFT